MQAMNDKKMVKKTKNKRNNTFLPSIFITGVHPPSPHPKSRMWHRTETDIKSTRG